MLLGIDPEIGISAFRLWIAAGAAAVLVAVVALSLVRLQANLLDTVARVAAVAFAAGLGGLISWAFLGAARDQGFERRALEMRAQQLAAQALAPGSPLACLDSLTGETVQTACEKALFAAPATVATGISFVAARFALLGEIAAYKKRGDAAIENALLPLQRALEADPFGFLAHVLALRDGCTGDNCKALELLHDPTHVRTNLIAGTLDQYIERYREEWAKAVVAEAMDVLPGTAAAAAGNPPGQRKVTVNIDFPSAASIPPVSIMNSEPKAPAPAAAAGSGAPGSNGAGSSGRQVRKNGGGQGAAKPTTTEQTDPVWTPAPPTPAPAPAHSAPANANAAPPGTAPVQLSPFGSPPEASAGMTAHTQ